MDEFYTREGKLKVTKAGRLINFWISTQDEVKLTEICKKMHRSRTSAIRELIHQEFDKIRKDD